MTTLQSLLKDCAQAGIEPIDFRPLGPEARKAAKALRDHLPEVEATLRTGTAGQIAALAGPYATAYRIAHHRAPDRGVMARHFDRAMTLWLAGDKTATQEDLMLMLEPILLTDGHALPYKYLQWRNCVIDRWLRELGRAATFRDQSPETSRKRLTLLHQADLWAFLPDQQQAKQRWHHPG